MNFVEDLSKEILAAVAPRISDAVLREVAARLKHEFIFRYSEDEAAEKLGISPATLAQLRKDGEIEHTYSVVPTYDEKGRPHGGRISYLPRHPEGYLLRHERKHYFGKREK